MLIHAARRRRVAHNDTSKPEIIEWTVDAVDYPSGRAQIEAAVGEDEILLYVRPER